MDAGTKLLLPYVRAIHRNAFGYDAPPSTLLAIMGAYEFDRLKQILGNFRSGLEVAEAFYIDDNNTIYMPTMEDLETTLSVVFHEMGHAKDNVEFNKSSNEFTSEAIGFYLDLVSCRNRIGTSGGADTIEGEIYLDNDGMPLLLKPDVCRRIPEEILESWVSFMVLKSGDDESHAMGRINFMFEMAERGSIREAMDAVIMAEPQAMKERVDSEIVHMEAPEFYERMLEVNDVVMEFIYSDGKESGEKHFVQSFSFSCNVGEMRDNEGIIRYCQEYAPRGSDLTPMKFLGRSLDDANNAGFAHFCSDGFGAPLGGTSCKVSFITEGEVQIGTAHATRAESAEAKK